MDSRRLILFFVFSFSVFLLLDAWQKEQLPVVAPTEQTTSGKPAPQAIPTPMPGDKLVASQGGGPALAPPQEASALAKGENIKVDTNFVRAEISTVGGDLRRLEFKKQRDVADKNKDFVLFDSRPDNIYVAQSGLIGKGLPTHRTEFKVRPGPYRLADGAADLVVRMDAVDSSGIKVTKSFRFNRSSYVIDVTYEITNPGPTAIQPYAYFQLLRNGKPPAGDSAMLPTYTGAAVYTEKDKFQKVSFKDMDKDKTPYPKNSNDGWVAMLQHYFFSAWLPKNGTPREFFTRHLDGGLYAAGVIVPVGTIEPGHSATLTVPLYAGPEEHEKLAKIAPGLDLTIDFGWLTIIAVPMFLVLSWIHHWVGNWGVAIILLTMLIKLLFFPLSQASYRSMGKMRLLAPKMQKLKEQYGSDRQRLQQAMMEMYKTEKINPLGGCLPVVVQIPVFISLYWTILASVELRHAPFMLWIQDLSSPDPWYILPVLMGATMLIQTKLNPTPPDPVQAKIMKIMPLAFSVFFFFFPAGLVLYWLVNNVLSIIQQWYINRGLEHNNPKALRKT